MNLYHVHGILTLQTPDIRKIENQGRAIRPKPLSPHPAGRAQKAQTTGTRLTIHLPVRRFGCVITAGENRARYRKPQPIDSPHPIGDHAFALSAESQHIQVTGGAKSVREPTPHQHCTFEHEKMDVFGLAKSIKQAFKEVASEHHLEFPLFFSSKILQARPNRGIDLLDFPNHPKATHRGKAVGLSTSCA